MEKVKKKILLSRVIPPEPTIQQESPVKSTLVCKRENLFAECARFIEKKWEFTGLNYFPLLH